MSRVASVLGMVVVIAAASWAVAQEQQQGAGRRGGGMLGQRGSVLGLLNQEKVQKELKLTEDQIAKIREAGQKVRTDMAQDYAALRDIQDRAQRRAKTTELASQADQKAREQLRGVLNQDQTRRLYQIRLQVRGVAASLASGRLATRLNLTDEQKEKIAGIDKAAQAKSAEASSGMRNLSAEERRAKMAETRKKVAEIRAEADKQALEVLTAEQKDSIEKAKGEKFEL